MSKNMDKIKICIDLKINDGDFGEFEFEIEKQFADRLFTVYDEVVKPGTVKGTDFMDYLSENQPDLAKAVKEAVINKLFWHCKENSDADNPYYFPLVDLIYDIDRRPIKPGSSILYTARITISGQNEFEYDFTNMD